MTVVQKRLQQLQSAAKSVESFAAKHPRALTASVVGALSCFAVTAFGIGSDIDVERLATDAVVKTLGRFDIGI